MAKTWKCGDRALALTDGPKIMGILNVTPDSFSDGGTWFDADSAFKRGLEMVAEGADIIDVGGESTRPGAEPVEAEDEIARVVPVIEKLAKEVDQPISIDTTKARVAQLALEAGASIVNDVSALRGDPGMAEVVRESGAGVVLMHMLGEPRTMQKDPRYESVVDDVRGFLLQAALSAIERGIDTTSIVIDPGIGFGKTLEHNLSLIKHLDVYAGDPFPLLVGPSRKNFIGLTLDAAVDDRLEGTAAVVSWCVANGADILRVHDVKEMKRVAKMTTAVMEAT